MCHRYTKGKRDLGAFARLALALLRAYKAQRHPVICSHSSPSTAPALTLPGRTWGVRRLLISAKAGHHQPLMPNSLLVYYLTHTAITLAD